MKTLKTYNEDQVKEFNLKQLANVYNIVALELNVKQIKKFSDKTKGQQRVIEIQKEYLAKLTEQKAPAKASKKSEKAGKTVSPLSGSSAFKAGSIREFIVEVAQTEPTYETLVELIVGDYKKPRSALPVDAAFAKQAINWMINQGFIELK